MNSKTKYIQLSYDRKSELLVMKTIINSLIELVDISDNKNRTELYKEMSQKLRNKTEEEQYQLMKLFYSNLCGLLAHSEMKRNEYDKLKLLLGHFQNTYPSQ